MSDPISDIKNDLRMSMTIAAFTGISWYIGAEINTSLFLLFKRRRGLYFWSCALASWGVVLQPLFIILADFGVWTNLKGSITMIYLTWLIMVVPQSWILYSRLHLIMGSDAMLWWLRLMLVVTSIVFSVPTIILGVIAQATNINPDLFRINLIWDRLQLTVFFTQETLLSVLYIYKTHKYLRDSALLSSSVGSSSSSRSGSETKQVLLHLIYTNVLLIALDISLLGVQYANLFYLQGALKPCVYGIKLKVEFAILNRLIGMARRRGHNDSSYSHGSQGLGTGEGSQSTRKRSRGDVSWLQQSQLESPDAEAEPTPPIGLGPVDAQVPRTLSRESQAPIWEGGSHAATSRG